MNKLIDNLIQTRWLESPRIIDAFQKIDRKNFLPDGSEELSGLNEALPIGLGQTISQPLVVAFMIEKLQPLAGDKILDIGSGSGWTRALLSYLVGEKGKVISLEIIKELKEFGERNVSKYDFIKKGVAQFVCTDGSKGYPKEAPFDKILCSAEAKELPQAWKEQLKISGRIVTPIRNSICVFSKKSEQGFEKEDYPGFVFVPLVKR